MRLLLEFANVLDDIVYVIDCLYIRCNPISKNIYYNSNELKVSLLILNY